MSSDAIDDALVTAAVVGPGRRLGKKLLPAHLALPLIMLDKLFTGEDRIRFESEQLSVTVQVPTTEWVKPVAKAAAKLADWRQVVEIAKAPAPRDIQNDPISDVSDGGRVFCVSTDVKRFLPRSVWSTADLDRVMPAPDDDDIEATVRAITGRDDFVLPAGIGRGLGFDTLCACLRRGSTPEQCFMRLGKARAALKQDDPQLTAVPELHELRGYGPAMVWARSVVDDIERWRDGKLAFRDIQGAAVLGSAPGLGKTTLVRSIAKTAGLPLFTASVAGWFSQGTGYLDSFIKQIDRTFAEASAAGPAVLLLDELDAVPNRATVSPRNADWWAPVVAHLLTILDGAEAGPRANLIVIGATNFPNNLDAALVRPGRLSRIILIEPPDRTDLAFILRQHLGDDVPDLDTASIAVQCQGMSGAAAAELVKNARAHARAHGREKMTQADLIDLVMPAETRPIEFVRRVCFHEAGHAVVAHVTGAAEVDRVSSMENGVSGGLTSFATNERLASLQSLRKLVMLLLGGLAAELVEYGDYGGGGGGTDESDLAKATKIATSLRASFGLGDSLLYRAAVDDVPKLLQMDPHLRAAVEKDLRGLFEETCEIVRSRLDCVRAVAAALFEERFLDRARFLEVMEPEGSPLIGEADV